VAFANLRYINALNNNNNNDNNNNGKEAVKRVVVAAAVGGVAQWGWWRGSVVERRSLAGELSLSCARPAADG